MFFRNYLLKMPVKDGEERNLAKSKSFQLNSISLILFFMITVKRMFKVYS